MILYHIKTYVVLNNQINNMCYWFIYKFLTGKKMLYFVVYGPERLCFYGFLLLLQFIHFSYFKLMYISCLVFIPRASKWAVAVCIVLGCILLHFIDDNIFLWEGVCGTAPPCSQQAQVRIAIWTRFIERLKIPLNCKCLFCFIYFFCFGYEWCWK